MVSAKSKRGLIEALYNATRASKGNRCFDTIKEDGGYIQFKPLHHIATILVSRFSFKVFVYCCDSDVNFAKNYMTNFNS